MEVNAAAYLRKQLRALWPLAVREGRWGANPELRGYRKPINVEALV